MPRNPQRTQLFQATNFTHILLGVSLPKICESSQLVICQDKKREGLLLYFTVVNFF